MRAYQTILFDLDGTLTDPGVGITKSVQYALKKFGIEAPELSALYPFIGPPLESSFQKFYGFTAEQATLAVTYYREYFRPTGIFENVVYEGVPALLTRLKNADKRLAVATSKPTEFAGRILEHFHLAQYFDLVVGSNFDGTRSRKGEVILFTLNALNVIDKSAAVMVGDREHDILGAKEAGLDSIGVLYGYGDREELTRAGATLIAETVEAVGNLILSGPAAL